MEITATYRVETIENGFVVRHIEAARTVHVRYRHEVARQIEQFAHDEVVARMEAQAALEAEALADRLSRMENTSQMQQDEG